MRSAPAYQLGGLPHLRLGVTTGHGEDVLWRAVNTTGKHHDELKESELLAILVKTFESKRTRAAPDLLLAIDVWPHVLATVRQRFVADHRATINSLAFSEIWWCDREEPIECIKECATTALPWIESTPASPTPATSSMTGGFGEGFSASITIDGKKIDIT